MVSAFVVILLVVSILAAAISVLVGPPRDSTVRFVAWYALALAAALHIVAAAIPFR
jgi:ABC-type transport system involved in multi-copper enzyme maturation permease subunit